MNLPKRSLSLSLSREPNFRSPSPFVGDKLKVQVGALLELTLEFRRRPVRTVFASPLGFSRWISRQSPHQVVVGVSHDGFCWFCSFSLFSSLV